MIAMDSQYRVFSRYQQGSNHVKADKPCEDYADSYQNEHMCICVVADGHGSDNYPRTERGSHFAVRAAIDCVKEFLQQVSPEDILGRAQAEVMGQLERSILNSWYTQVEDDIHGEALTDKELDKVSDKYKMRYKDPDYLAKAYGTTLIVFAVTECFSFGLQIGDGSCIVMDTNGNLSLPIPSDPDCQLNVTTSICDADASSEFRYYVVDRAPAAVFCGTDGVEDSYSSVEELYDLHRSIILMFSEKGFEEGSSEIAEYLPILTRKGSGDDVSMAGIIQLDTIQKIRGKLQQQTQLAKIARDLDEETNHLHILQESYKKWMKRPIGDILPKLFQKYPSPEMDKLKEQKEKIEQCMKDIESLEREKITLEKAMNNADDIADVEGKIDNMEASSENIEEVEKTDLENTSMQFVIDIEIVSKDDTKSEQ